MLRAVSQVSSLPMPLPQFVESQPDWFGAGFGADMVFMTADGATPAAWLRPGDLVQTMDNGMQPLALVERQMTQPELVIRSHDIAGGEVLPSTQRALVCGWKLELHFDHAEMLVALGAIAPALPSLMAARKPNYILAFEEPQLIHCDGLWLEASSMAAHQPARPHMTGIEARAIGLNATDLIF